VQVCHIYGDRESIHDPENEIVVKADLTITNMNMTWAQVKGGNGWGTSRVKVIRRAFIEYENGEITKIYKYNDRGKERTFKVINPDYIARAIGRALTA
jgi:hypothetical protein